MTKVKTHSTTSVQIKQVVKERQQEEINKQHCKTAKTINSYIQGTLVRSRAFNSSVIAVVKTFTGEEFDVYIWDGLKTTFNNMFNDGDAICMQTRLEYVQNDNLTGFVQKAISLSTSCGNVLSVLGVVTNTDSSRGLHKKGYTTFAIQPIREGVEFVYYCCGKDEIVKPYLKEGNIVQLVGKLLPFDKNTKNLLLDDCVLQLA